MKGSNKVTSQCFRAFLTFVRGGVLRLDYSLFWGWLHFMFSNRNGICNIG